MLKASFRNLPKNHGIKYQDTSITLIISPGQPYHEAEKFSATIELINRSNFKQCFIMIGDTNYRHTIKVYKQFSDKEAYVRAMKTGNDWLERNYKYIKMLTCDYKIIRWDSLLEHTNYPKYRKITNNLFLTNPKVKEDFLYSAEQFLQRSKEPIIVSRDDAINYCLEYLLEECAIIIPLWSSKNNCFYVYPQKMLKAMEATYLSLVKPKTHIHWHTLRFKSYYQIEKEKSLPVELANG